jgi:signal transduction histidine kinase/ligand-binding sensor domain-containing protein
VTNRLIAFGLIASATLSAQLARADSRVLGPSISQLTHTTWTAKDGIPGPVRAIRQTADGYLWLGTEAGLYRFDGLRFVAWTSAESPSFPAGAILSLCAARDGSLWIGFGARGVAHLAGGRLTTFAPGAGVPAGGILSIVEDADGAIWAGGQYGFSKYEHGTWRAIGRSDGYPAPGAQALGVDREGTLWAVTDGLNFGLDPNPILRNTVLYLKRHDTQFKPTGLAEGQVWSMSQAPDGSMWLAETSRGTVRRLAESFQVQEITTPPSPVVVLFDDDDAVWVGLIGRGLRRASGASRRPTAVLLDGFAAGDGLSGDLVYSTFLDREGNRWFGTSRGLDRFRNSRVTSFSAREGLIPDSQIALTSAGTRGVWLFSYTTNAVRRFQDGRIYTSLIGVDSPPDSLRLLSLFADRKGRAWAGGSFKLARETGGVFALAYASEIEAGANVEAITVDAAGALWIAETQWSTAAGTVNAPKVLRLKDGVWTDFSRRGEFPPFKSRVMFADPEGSVWIGFENGEVARYAKGQVRRFGAADGLPGGRVFSIAGDRRGGIWVGGEGGLSRFDGGRFVTLSRQNGLLGSSVSGIVEDDSGFLWLACALGILRVSEEELRKAVRLPAYRMEGLTIGAGDGLRGFPRQKEPFPVATKAEDGRLWFATTTGIAVVDPYRLPTNHVLPPVVIESIKADDRQVAATSGLRLPARTRRLEIGYTALSLTDPERVQFLYQLEGYDSAWRGPVTARQLTYTNLPPASYRFRLKASNNDGLWNEEGATLAFTILPAFYQTNAFRMSVAALVALAGWMAYRLRVGQVARRINLRYEERLAERERIARELHDTLLQGTYGLILRFQAVADHIPASEPTRLQMNEALERADQVVAEGRKRVEGLRGADAAGDLAEAFTRAGAELTDGSGIELKVIVEGRAQSLLSAVRDEAYWIGREALLNAFHTAEATHVEIELIYGRRELRMRCRDDGKGIDPAILDAGGRPGHFGIRGMRERAARIGGRLEILSRVGAGTEIDLTIPGALAYRRRAGLARTWLRRLQ